jgi:hypothetical protein
MKITGLFNIKKRGIVVCGISPWQDNIQHKLGDILTCGTKQWRVIAVDHFRQGCFYTPKDRMHSLQLEPVGHNSQPNIDDELI